MRSHAGPAGHLPRLAAGLVPLLALALAGCISGSAPLAPASLPPVVAHGLAFGPAKAMDQPTMGGEPNVAALPDGTLFITAVAGSQDRPNALEGAAWLWRSRDHGATWDTLREPLRVTPLGDLPLTRKPFGSSDADVVASADGWVYYTDWWNWGAPVQGTPRVGNYLVESSGDGGQTWSQAPVTTLDGLTGSVDRQWLLAGPDGHVGLFYAYFHPVQNDVRGLGDLYGRADFIMSIDAVFSADHGATWGSPVVVAEPIPGHSYQIAHPFMVNKTVMAMPYADVGPGTSFWQNPGQVRVMLSEDGGLSWYPRVVADVPEGFDNLWAVQGAADAHGRVVVAWAARANDTMPVWMSESTDLGRTWSTPLALRAEGLNALPWVAARGEGQVAVGWYGSNATGDPALAPNGTAWFSYVAERAGAGSPFRLADASGGPVKVGALCPRGAACTQDRELLDYVGLAYDAQGQLHHAFARSREVDGKKAGLVHYAGELHAG